PVSVPVLFNFCVMGARFLVFCVLRRPKKRTGTEAGATVWNRQRLFRGLKEFGEHRIGQFKTPFAQPHPAPLAQQESTLKQPCGLREAILKRNAEAFDEAA